jgi:HAE1 family hydrophobic/amphiphilic exporter-1
MNKIAVIIILAAALGSSAWAQTNAPGRVMSLDDCVAQALKHNFDVQNARYEPQVSLYELYASYSAYDPTLFFNGYNTVNKSGQNGTIPTVIKGDTYQANLNTTDTPWGMTYGVSSYVTKNFPTATNGTVTSGGNVTLSVSQPLLKNLWIDDNRLKIAINKDKLKNSEQALRLQMITTIVAVETAYYELVYAHENVEVQQEALTLAQTQLDQDQQRLEIGTLAQLSVQLDQSQVAQDRANLITAQYTLAQDQNTLKNLITDQYQDWHDTDIDPSGALEAVKQPFDLQDSWSKGMTLRPELLQDRLTVAEQGITLKYDRNQLYPELDLNGSYGFNGNAGDNSGVINQIGEANRSAYQFGASLSVPLSNLNARNTYKADKATQEQFLLTLKEEEQTIMVAIDNAVKLAQSDYESVEATRQARVYAEEALDAEQKTYAVGKATTFEVLTYQNNLTTAKGQEIRALANYEESLSNLAQQEGSTLQRRKVDFEVE